MIDYCEEEERRQHIKRQWLAEIEMREYQRARRARLWDYTEIALAAIGCAIVLWLSWWVGKLK